MEKHYSNAHSRLNAEAEEGPLYFLVIESLGLEEKKKIEKEIGWHLFITPTVCQWCVRTSANTLTLSSLSFSLSLSHTHTHTIFSLSLSLLSFPRPSRQPRPFLSWLISNASFFLILSLFKKENSERSGFSISVISRKTTLDSIQSYCFQRRLYW